MKSFWAGTAVAAVGAAVARPLLVGTIRAGYEVKDVVGSAWDKAKAEVDSLNAEAVSGRRADAEIEALRAENATLKAQLTKK